MFLVPVVRPGPQYNNYYARYRKEVVAASFNKYHTDHMTILKYHCSSKVTYVILSTWP